MLNEDNASYYKYTGPQRLDKAIHTLEGIVRGVAIDAKVNDKELSALTRWVADHRRYANRHPFNEVIPRLHEVLADGTLDEEEKADILWLCEKFTTDNMFFSEVSSDMQRLQGLVGGVVADGVITKEELQGLRDWMDEHTHLRTCWPYDEIDALILAVLQDGLIDENEHRALTLFFSEFMERPGHRAIELRENKENVSITGICAACPEIQIPDHLFCFTGRSEKCSRQELACKIERHGGRFTNSVVKDVDYLVVGADGNPCWAYACYGRKVEMAIKHRRQGSTILLVHEYDFWDAVQDLM